MNRFATIVRRGAIPVGALALVGQANAAAIDVGDVVSEISAQAGPVAAIGSAILVLIVGIKAFQWVRRALA